jgi:hypothetical protein
MITWEAARKMALLSAISAGLEYLQVAIPGLPVLMLLVMHEDWGLLRPCCEVPYLIIRIYVRRLILY